MFVLVCSDVLTKLLLQILLRRFWSSFTYQRRGAIGRAVLSCLYVGLLAYVTAFMETLTISGVGMPRLPTLA